MGLATTLQDHRHPRVNGTKLMGVPVPPRHQMQPQGSGGPGKVDTPAGTLPGENAWNGSCPSSHRALASHADQVLLA